MSTVPTIKRRPKVGDIVSARGSERLWLVEEIYYRHAISNRVEFYGVVATDHPDMPNAFNPGEVAVVAAHVARQHEAAVERRRSCCPECTLSPEAERDLLANTDPDDACPDCGRPADYGCHDLCPSDIPVLSEDQIGVAPW